MEDCFHIAFFPSNFDTFIHILFDLRITFEVSVDQYFCFAPWYIQSFGEAEYRYAINDTEVRCFGLSSHIGSYGIDRNFVNFCGCGCVDIRSLPECFYHVPVSAQVCHDTQFYLRVVGREENAVFIRYECTAYFPPFVVADRYVLQVRVAGTESSGGGNRLVERGMYLSRFGIDQFGQGIDIGTQ